jgi:hypothetical protein
MQGLLHDALPLYHSVVARGLYYQCTVKPPVHSSTAHARRRSSLASCTRGQKWTCGAVVSSCMRCCVAHCPLMTRWVPPLASALSTLHPAPCTRSTSRCGVRPALPLLHVTPAQPDLM